MWLKEGTIVDATIIEAPSSTKNRSGQRDPEMRQVKKGNQYHFGMKLHIGTDAATGLVHSFTTTSANVHDVTQAHRLLHGGETQVWGGCWVFGGTEAGRESGVGPSVAGGVAAWATTETGAGQPRGPGGTDQGVGKGESGTPLPESKGSVWLRQGTLPGSGQEHRAVGVTAGPDQPDHRPTLPSHLTQGVVGPNLVRKHPGTQTQRETGPQSPKTAKQRDPNPTKTSHHQ